MLIASLMLAYLPSVASFAQQSGYSSAGVAFGAEAADAARVGDIAVMTRVEAEKNQPCDVTGVVTCVFAGLSNSFTIASAEDPNGPAVYVGGDLRDRPLARVVGNRPVRVGDIVHVRGHIVPLMLEPGVAAATIEVVGSRELPPPPEMRLADLGTGRYNNRCVSVTGVLRDVRFEGTKTHGGVTVLVLGMTDGTLRVLLRGTWQDFAAFRNAKLSIDGVCLPSYNERAEFLRPEVMAFSHASVHHVPSRTSARPTTVSTLRPLGVLAWTPEGYDGHLRTLRGEVTYVDGEHRFFVLQADTAIRVDLSGGPLPVVGDLVEAEGFPTLSDDCGILDAGMFRPLGHAKSPRAAEEMSVATLERFLATGELGVFDAHYRLVKIVARAIGVDRRADGSSEITLAVGSQRMKARLAAGAGDLSASLADEPPIVASGVLKVHYEGNTRAGRGVMLAGFTLLMRDAGDLVVLDDTATRRRRLLRGMTRAGLLLLLPLALVALWMGLKVVRQRERVRAVAADRKRMAEELHDTIAQYLSGARLLLFSVKAESSALSEASRGALEMSGDILETARRELRDKILNLQADEVMLRPLAWLLKNLAEKTNAAGGVRVRSRLRGLPEAMSSTMKNDILALVQEAMTNAVRHGRARKIAIVSDPLPDGGFALGILNDGAPFDAATALGPETGHFGISGMRERAKRNGLALTFGMRERWTEVRVERKGHD